MANGGSIKGPTGAMAPAGKKEKKKKKKKISNALFLGLQPFSYLVQGLVPPTWQWHLFFVFLLVISQQVYDQLVDRKASLIPFAKSTPFFSPPLLST
jgi:hypothetical protein